ncbi:carbohydrate deacetylase [Plakobranchus ocellatus]|uniref:Carbohydrate deacetylase n=1 Tax=Plakobranchus ocellatus TaxID=259542 RepID=A0AAV4BKH8_9GAST|nr:carbohydrate deacetylase [Plakobranchus ocellatus]
MKTQLIITADDFGFSKERNIGIMEAFSNGAVQSASLLLNCTGSTDAIERAKKTSITLGLHLNLTEGTPVGQDEYKTLTSSGIFRGRQGMRDSLTKGEIQISEIENEIDSQIKRFIELVGEKPAYVDGHQHIHLHPVVSPIFAAALKNHGVSVTRMPVEVNLKAKTWLGKEAFDLLSMFVEEARSSAGVLQKYNIRTSECFTGLSTMGANMTAERLQSLILEAFKTVEENLSVETVTCELMTHPGYPTPKEYGGFSWGTDDFGHSDDRIHEIKVLSSDTMINFYKAHKIVLVSHRELY